MRALCVRTCAVRSVRLCAALCALMRYMLSLGFVRGFVPKGACMEKTNQYDLCADLLCARFVREIMLGLDGVH